MNRDEQIQLMKECVVDAEKTMERAVKNTISITGSIAIAFFEYRSRNRFQTFVPKPKNDITMEAE